MSEEQVKKLIAGAGSIALPPKILEPTKAATDEYGHGYGSEIIVLTDEHLAALLDHKMLAWSDGEYTHFLVRGERSEEPPTWISAEESLPSCYNQVWLCDKIAGVVKGWRCAPEQYLDTGIEKWCTGMENRAVSLHLVTHWQPIVNPEPPGWPD